MGSNFILNNSAGASIAGNYGNEVSGAGIQVLSGGVATLNNEGTITGGYGGGAGISGNNFTLNNLLGGTIAGGDGYKLRAGGAGVSGSGFTVNNSGSVAGGAGDPRPNYGGGVGGAGVSGSSLTLINSASGVISGGTGAFGPNTGIGGAGVEVLGGTVAANSLSNYGSIKGGIGGDGEHANSGAIGGAGVSGSNFALTNASGAAITGGNGGAAPQAVGGYGGSGVAGSGFTVNNSGSIIGGNGGAGNTRGNAQSPAIGGQGGYGINGSGFTVNNSGLIAGGNGGAGGYGGYNGTSYTASKGGAGGAGIQVLSGAAATIMNTALGNITGGVGGVGGAALSSTGADGGAGGAGILVTTGATSSINNLGSITGGAGGLGGSASGNVGAGGAGVQVDAGGTISTLTNMGSILGAIVNGAITQGYDILNNGTIATFNNLQGASSSALTYSGKLPTNYSIIVNSATNYGQLAVTSVTGQMIFRVYSSSTLIANHQYLSVLTGVVAGNLTGSYINQVSAGYKWSLLNTSGTTWELDVGDADSGGGIPVVAGPTTADTQQSLVNTVSALQNIYTLQNSILANSFSYDCSLFDVNNICISAGGRNTAVQAANGLNNTSGLLIGAYRPHQNYRIGAYVDQNLSMSNAGSAVSLGNNTPLIGLFGAWNERLDGTGAELKVSVAYGQKNATVTRSVVGTSEAGSGSSQLNSQGAQVTAKYGFAVMPKVIVSPYVGMRYTQNNMGGYTETMSSTVTAPLTYSALNINASTILAGLGASYQFIPKATVFASAGLEADTNAANGTYSATGVVGLTPINFNVSPVKTRPTATLGAYYDVQKYQRLGITGIYRQEQFQAVSTTAVMATYTVGL
jgi:hypothetical protein